MGGVVCQDVHHVEFASSEEVGGDESGTERSGDGGEGVDHATLLLDRARGCRVERGPIHPEEESSHLKKSGSTRSLSANGLGGAEWLTMEKRSDVLSAALSYTRDDTVMTLWVRAWRQAGSMHHVGLRRLSREHHRGREPEIGTESVHHHRSTHV